MQKDNHLYVLGDELDRGHHGKIFNSLFHSNRVIKLSTLFDYENRNDGILDSDFSEINSRFLAVQKYNEKCLVRLFYWDIYWRDGLQIPATLTYFSVMEKLIPLSEDESKVFHTTISHEDANLKKNLSSSKLEEVLFGLSKGLTFNFAKTQEFHRQIASSIFFHTDMHPRNIMKNANGDFKLIDLDSLVLR